MDQTLNLKLADFKKALHTLDKALNKKKTELVRDAVIKRFEYTYEIAWKTAKVVLSEIYGVDIFSPKMSFRELKKNQLLSDEETELLLQMTDDRNEIIHAYDEAFSNKLYLKIKQHYYPVLKKLYTLIAKQT